MKIINYFKLLYARLTGKATHVEYLALPVTGLTYEFLFRINGGEWEEGRITIQEQYVSGGKPPIQIHFDHYLSDSRYYLSDSRYYWSEPARIKGPAYYTVLRNKNKIKRAVASITKQYGVEL